MTTLVKISNVNPVKKNELYNEFYNSTEKQILKDIKSNLFREKKFEYFFDLYFKLNNARLLKKKEYIINFPYYSMTCVPFETCMYVSSKNCLYHCEKVSEINTLGKIVEKNNKIFDLERITLITNNFINKVIELGT